MFSKAIRDLQAGAGLYYVWIYQSYHDITAKYKRTFLGSFWLAGGMLVTSMSMALLFGLLFRQPLHVILPYVMSGMLCFGLVAFVFNDGPEMFMMSGGIIKNHAYPFTFYGFHTVCKSFFLFLHNMVVYWVVMALFGVVIVPHWSILLSIPLVLVFMFTTGSLAGMLAARYRDMRFMLPYVGQIMSYVVPIFWHGEQLPRKALDLIQLNPFYNLLQVLRLPLLGQVPSALAWQLAAGYTAIACLIWFFVFVVFRRRIPFWV